MTCNCIDKSWAHFKIDSGDVIVIEVTEGADQEQFSYLMDYLDKIRAETKEHTGKLITFLVLIPEVAKVTRIEKTPQDYFKPASMAENNLRKAAANEDSDLPDSSE